MVDINEILDVFVDRLEDIMKEKGWNISELAKQLNIPRRTLNSWLLKKRVPRIDYIYFISNYFNVSIDYLLGKEQ